MLFKDETVQKQFFERPLFLQVICAEFETLCFSYGIIPTVTRVTEAVSGSSGVHEAGLAVDFRDEHAGKFTFTDEQKDKIARILNENYARTDGHPTILFHSFCGGPLHAHVQIHADMSVYVIQQPKEKI